MGGVTVDFKAIMPRIINFRTNAAAYAAVGTGSLYGFSH
jgi:hypothetical protein